MSNKNLPPGIDPNRVSKIDFNKLSETMQHPQQHPQQVPQPPQQQVPQQQVPPQQVPQHPQQQVPPQHQPMNANQMQNQQVQQQVPQQAPPKKVENTPEVKRKIAETHPVLMEVLKNFGLNKEEVMTNTLYFGDNPDDPVHFQQSEYEEALETWAIQEGQFKARIEGEAEGMDWYQTLLAALSVVGMNDTPLYEIFQIELLDNEKERISAYKYDVSERVRKLTAKPFAILLVSRLKGFSEKIAEFYVSKLKRDSLVSSMDSEKEDYEQFICPEFGCTEVILERPRLDATGKKLPYYCKLHGVVMEGVLDMGEPKAPLV